MHFSPFQWFLIIGTVLLQVTILTVMVRRKTFSSFPFFFNFVAFSLVSFVLRSVLASHISSSSYVYLYWTTSAIAVLISFAVMYEVFVNVLKPYSALVDLGKLLFRWAILFLLLASLLTAFSSSGSEVTKFCAGIQLLARSTQLMQCGLLLLLLLFETRLGLSWRAPATSIMIGFGLNAALALLAPLVEDRVPAWSYALAMLGPVTCVLVYAGWCASLVLPQPQRRTVQDSPTRLILQRWNEALLATPMLARNNQAALPVESFLPGVERAVERVMSRKMAN